MAQPQVVFSRLRNSVHFVSLFPLRAVRTLGFQRKLEWVRTEFGGNWYRLDEPPMEGWLCPAMFLYFNEAPAELYVKAEEIK